MRKVPRRILIVRPSALGDVCRTIPLAWSLRGAWPDSVIDWVVEDRWAGAIRGHPAVDRVIEFPKEEFRAVWRHPGVALRAAKWFRSLGHDRYDLAIDAQGLARSGLMALASRAGHRVGFRRSREFAFLAANDRVEVPGSMHTVDAMLALIEHLGIAPLRQMRLVTGDGARKGWQEMRESLGITGKYAVVASANKWEGKRWITSRWQQLAASIEPPLARAGVGCMVWIGGSGEKQQVAQNMGRTDARSECINIDLAGRTSVESTMAVIEGASLLVSLDSAPAHMAVGLGVPVVALYGATQPATDGPYGQERWCIHGGVGESLGAHAHRDPSLGRAMMERISVEEVAAMVADRLDAIEQPRR